MEELNFTLYVGGVIHNDPCGPESLMNWLKGIKVSRTEAPKFAALEFTETDAKNLISQRNQIGPILQSYIRNITQEDIEALKRGFMFEYDTLTRIFPSIPILWLEEGLPKTVDATEINTGAKNWSNTIGKKLLTIGNPSNMGGYARFWSIVSRKSGYQEVHNGNYSRDEHWAKALMNSIEGEPNWGIAIMGRAHTNKDDPQTFVSRLRQVGIDCIISDICPPHQKIFI